MMYVINELRSGKRVVLTEGNGRDDAANVCHLLNKHAINKAERWTVKEENMKREELDDYYYYEDTVMTPANHLHRVYHADDVDLLLDEKDAEIESLKASHYAEMVDAGMRERRLRRALWMARASEASKEVNYWTCQDESSYAIVDFNVRHETIVSYKAPHHRPYKWILIWENVERKCLKKAEEFK